MNRERCLVFVKPGNDLGLVTEIFGFIDERLKEEEKRGGDFRRTIPLHIHGVKREVIERHYSHIKDIPQYRPTIEAFVKGEVFVAVYEGENICDIIGRIRGETDCEQASSNTVRGIFGVGSLEEAREECRYYNNVIHVSGKGEGEEEIRNWSREYDLGCSRKE